MPWTVSVEDKGEGRGRNKTRLKVVATLKEEVESDEVFCFDYRGNLDPSNETERKAFKDKATSEAAAARVEWDRIRTAEEELTSYLNS